MEKNDDIIFWTNDIGHFKVTPLNYEAIAELIKFPPEKFKEISAFKARLKKGFQYCSEQFRSV